MVTEENDMNDLSQPVLGGVAWSMGESQKKG
jgi:hypothetical protein